MQTNRKQITCAYERAYVSILVRFVRLVATADRAAVLIDGVAHAGHRHRIERLGAPFARRFLLPRQVIHRGVQQAALAELSVFHAQPGDKEKGGAHIAPVNAP